MNSYSDSFLRTCRNAYFDKQRPFNIEIGRGELYQKLSSLANSLELSIFIGFLMEWQYYINLWASVLILEEFRPEKERKLIGLNYNVSVVDECIETIERYSENFDQTQMDNYKKWLSLVKTRYLLP
ncbi:hypothetical protein [Mucilaginibacter ginsenosidivorans]|uniref:Uncharacterized protein n=1 Tax=Mucilaginibacter ginsenosidivorans TaxID=398053 RepID=A0A5B8UX68_9SPHI|nr:hypothetical protein [Mucilaginibacter ginsenosidivorans]QEC63583.1 hypothetical protein FRZ54_13685 [Mucilaginibacter ginsenosidivorans]